MVHPTCQRCNRLPSDRIKVRGWLWEPAFEDITPEGQPPIWKCFVCRGEPHPDMPQGYLPDSFVDKRFPDG